MEVRWSGWFNQNKWGGPGHRSHSPRIRDDRGNMRENMARAHAKRKRCRERNLREKERGGFV